MPNSEKIAFKIHTSQAIENDKRVMDIQLIAANALASYNNQKEENEAVEFAKFVQLNFHEFDLGVYVSLLEENIDRPKQKFSIEQLYNKYKNR